MDFDPVLLSRIQFAFVISFHIIFPAFTIGLAAWLATIEGMHIATRDPIYRRVFDFWLKVFALSFGMGVVSGIVMAFQFGTNWSVLAERTGSIQGPLLGYEGFTAFMLEATFFGVMLLGRDRAPPWFYFLSCCMVSHAVVILDPLQQQLDAGADRSRHSRRQTRPGRLVGNHYRSNRAGALAAYAAGRLPDHGDEHRRYWRLVPVVPQGPSSGTGHAALGPRLGCGDHSGADVFRPPHGRVRPPLPTC